MSGEVSDPDVVELREGWRAIHRRLLRHSDMKLAEKEVLRNLLDRMGKGNICFPSQATIAWDCNLSRGHVNEALKSLCARGFITKMPRQRRQSLSYRMNTRALLDWAESEPEPYPLEAISNEDNLTVRSSDDKILLSEIPTPTVRLSDTACQNFLHPEVIPGSKSQGSKKTRTLASPLTPEEEDAFASEFADVPHVRDEIEAIKGMPQYFTHKNKPAAMRRYLNFARDRAVKFNSPRNESNRNRGGSPGSESFSATSHNGGQPVPQSLPTFEEERREKMRAFAQRRAEGRV